MIEILKNSRNFNIIYHILHNRFMPKVVSYNKLNLRCFGVKHGVYANFLDPICTVQYLVWSLVDWYSDLTHLGFCPTAFLHFSSHLDLVFILFIFTFSSSSAHSHSSISALPSRKESSFTSSWCPVRSLVATLALVLSPVRFPLPFPHGAPHMYLPVNPFRLKSVVYHGWTRTQNERESRIWLTPSLDAYWYL